MEKHVKQLSSLVLYQSDYVGVNGNVIMSGCRDDDPDDEGKEAARDNTKSVSRGGNPKREASVARRTLYPLL